MTNYLFGLFLLALGTPAVAVAGTADEPTAGEKIKKGLANVKDGTQEAAKEVGVAAEKAGQNASEVGKKVEVALKSATCPVVGDRKTKFYYASDSKSYEAVLSGQKYFQDDDRDCFMTEKGARDEGYARSPD